MIAMPKTKAQGTPTQVRRPAAPQPRTRAPNPLPNPFTAQAQTPQRNQTPQYDFSDLAPNNLRNVELPKIKGNRKFSQENRHNKALEDSLALGEILTGAVTGTAAFWESAGRTGWGAITGQGFNIPETTFFEEAHRRSFEGIAGATGTERALPEAHKSLLADFRDQIELTERNPSVGNILVAGLYGAGAGLEGVAVGGLVRGAIRSVAPGALARTIGKSRIAKVGYTDAVARVAEQKKLGNVEDLTIPNLGITKQEIPKVAPKQPLKETEKAVIKKGDFAPKNQPKIEVIKDVPDEYLLQPATITKNSLATSDTTVKRSLSIQPSIAKQYNAMAQSEYARVLLTHDKPAYDNLIIRMRDRLKTFTDELASQRLTKPQFNAKVKNLLNETRGGITKALRAKVPEAVKNGKSEVFLRNLNKALDKDIQNFPKNATDFIYNSSKPVQSEITMLSRQFRDNLVEMRKLGMTDLPRNPIAQLKSGVYEKVIQNRAIGTNAIGKEVYNQVRKNYMNIVGKAVSKNVKGRLELANTLSKAEKTKIDKYVNDLIKKDINLPQLTVRMRDIEELLNREFVDITALRSQLETQANDAYEALAQTDNPALMNDVSPRQVRKIGKDLKKAAEELKKFDGTPEQKRILQDRVEELQNNYDHGLALNSFVMTDDVDSIGALFGDPTEAFKRTLLATGNPLKAAYATKSLNETEWGSFRKFMTNSDGETLNPVIAKAGGDTIDKAYTSHALGQDDVMVNLSNPVQEKVKSLSKQLGEKTDGKFYGEFSMSYMAFAEVDRMGLSGVKKLQAGERDKVLDEIAEKTNQMLEYAGSEKKVTKEMIKDKLIKRIDTTDAETYEKTAGEAIRSWGKEFMGSRARKIYDAQQDAYDNWMKNYGDPEFNKLNPNTSLLLNKKFQRRTNYMPIKYIKDEKGRIAMKADEIDDAISDEILKSADDSLTHSAEQSQVRLGQPTGEREVNVVQGIVDPNWVKNLGHAYLKQKVFNDVAQDLYSSLKFLNKAKTEGRINDTTYRFLKKRLSYITSYSKADQIQTGAVETIFRFLNLSQVYTSIATPYYKVGSLISDKVEIVRDMTRAYRQFIPTADAWTNVDPKRIDDLEKYLPELRTDVAGRRVDISGVTYDANVEKFGDEIQFAKKGAPKQERVFNTIDWMFSKPSQWFINSTSKGARIKSLVRFSLHDFYKKHGALPKTVDQMFAGEDGAKRLARARAEVDTKLGSNAPIARSFTSTEGDQFNKFLTLFSGFGVRNGSDVANSFFKSSAARKAGKPRSSDQFAAPLGVISRQMEAEATYQWGKLATRNAVSELFGQDDEITADPERINSYVLENVGMLPLNSTRYGLPITDGFRSIIKGYQVGLFADNLPKFSTDITSERAWADMFKSTPAGIVVNKNGALYPFYRYARDATSAEAAQRVVNSNLIRIYRSEESVTEAFAKSDKAWNTGDGYVYSLKKHLGTLNLSEYTEKDYNDTSFEMFRKYYFKPSQIQKIKGDNYTTGIGNIASSGGGSVRLGLSNKKSKSIKDLRYIYNILSLSDEEYIAMSERARELRKSSMRQSWDRFRSPRTGEIRESQVNKFVRDYTVSYGRVLQQRNPDTKKLYTEGERDRLVGKPSAVDFYLREITAMGNY